MYDMTAQTFTFSVHVWKFTRGRMWHRYEHILHKSTLCVRCTLCPQIKHQCEHTHYRLRFVNELTQEGCLAGWTPQNGSAPSHWEAPWIIFLSMRIFNNTRFNHYYLNVNVHWQTCPSGLRKTWIIFLTFHIYNISDFGFLCMSLS